MSLIECILEYATKVRIEGCYEANLWLEGLGIDPALHVHIQNTVNNDGDLIDGDGEIITFFGE
jgi:hypothetical protein